MEAKTQEPAATPPLDSKVAGQEIAGARHTISQGIEHNIRINIVGAKSLGILTRLTAICQPRLGATPRESALVDLPPPVAKVLEGAEKNILPWLASSDENQRLFLKDPLLALKTAGANIPRHDLKFLSRTRATIAAAEMIPPGTQIRSLVVRVVPNKKGVQGISKDARASKTGKGKEA